MAHSWLKAKERVWRLGRDESAEREEREVKRLWLNTSCVNVDTAMEEKI